MKINDIPSKLDSVVASVLNISFLKQLSLLIINRIRVRVRLGKGVKEQQGGQYQTAHQLPKLKESTKLRRKRLQRVGQLTGPNAQPNKSGLNRSGLLLNRIHSQVTGNSVKLKLDKRGADIIKYLTERDQDFEFFNLSKAEYNGIVRIIQDKIKDTIKQEFT